MKEKVSIIIPTFNSEKYIKKCIESICKQTYVDFEIIIINDGSIDNTKKICEQFMQMDNRIKLINKENTGVSDSRNMGLDIANGEYVLFVDSDDWIEEKMLETLVKYIKEKNVDIIKCNYYSDKKKDKSIYEGYIDNKNEYIKELINGNIPCYIWSFLIKKEIINNIRFNKEISFMEDKLWIIEIIKNASSVFVCNEKLYHYEESNINSITRNPKNYSKKIMNTIKVTSELEKVLVNNTDLLISMYSTHAKYIEIYLFGIFKLYGKKEFKIQTDKIKDNDKLKCIFYNVSLGNLKTHMKISIYLIKKGKFKLLSKYYTIRVFMIKILHKKH